MFDEKFQDHLQVFATDETLFEQGDSGDEFFIIREGLVDVRTHREGDEFLLASVGPGKIVGEMALIDDDHTRSATVVAQTRVKALKFSKERFDNFLKESKSFRDFIVKNLMNRIRSTNEHVYELDEHRNHMFDATRLLLGMASEIDWYGQESLELNAGLTSEFVEDNFDLENAAVQRLFEIDNSRELKRLPPNIQENLLETAKSIFETMLSKTQVNFPDSDEQAEIEFVEQEDSLEDYLQTADNLLMLVNNPEKLSENDLDKIDQRNDTLKDQLKELEESSDDEKDDEKLKKLQAHVDGIEKKISEISE